MSLGDDPCIHFKSPDPAAFSRSSLMVTRAGRFLCVIGEVSALDFVFTFRLGGEALPQGREEVQGPSADSAKGLIYKGRPQDDTYRRTFST